MQVSYLGPNQIANFHLWGWNASECSNPPHVLPRITLQSLIEMNHGNKWANILFNIDTPHLLDSLLFLGKQLFLLFKEQCLKKITQFVLSKVSMKRACTLW